MRQDGRMWTDNLDINPEQWEALFALRTVGRPLLVGGCIRDAQLGLRSKDVDVEVHDVRDVEAFIDVLRRFGKVDEVGQMFAVFKVAGMDISLPRRETKSGVKHRDFDVVVDAGMSVEEASARRDFTINAMMFDPISREFIDPHHGARDRFYGVLRHTSDAFAEDPLRVLRGVQFAARFGFTFAPETAELCKSLSDQFETIHPDRIWTEIEKLITKGKFFERGYWALKDSGWDVHFPTTRNNWRTAQKLRTTENMPLILAAMFSESFGDELGVPHSIRKRALTYMRMSEEIADVINETTLSQKSVDIALRKIARRNLGFGLTDAARLVDCASWTLECGASESPVPLNINGDDIISLGVKPGPMVGVALTKIGVEVDTFGSERPRDEMMNVARVLLDNLIVKG